MKRFQDKRRFKKFLYSKFSVFILIVVFLFMGKAVFNAYQKYAVSSEGKQSVLEEVHEITERKEFLEEELSRLQSERGVEEELRKKFQIAKPGEQVIIIVGEEE